MSNVAYFLWRPNIRWLNVYCTNINWYAAHTKKMAKVIVLFKFKWICIWFLPKNIRFTNASFWYTLTFREFSGTGCILLLAWEKAINIFSINRCECKSSRNAYEVRRTAQWAGEQRGESTTELGRSIREPVTIPRCNVSDLSNHIMLN